MASPTEAHNVSAINAISGRTAPEGGIDFQKENQGLANRFRPQPPKENAAPAGPRGGVEKVYEGVDLRFTEYAEAMAEATAIDIPDQRVWEIPLSSGETICVRADDTGLIAARDFLHENGAVYRLETRIYCCVPPLFYGEDRA